MCSAPAKTVIGQGPAVYKRYHFMAGVCLETKESFSTLFKV